MSLASASAASLLGNSPPPPPPRPSQRVYSASPARVSSVPPTSGSSSFRYSAPPESRTEHRPSPRPPPVPSVRSRATASPVSSMTGGSTSAAVHKGKDKAKEEATAAVVSHSSVVKAAPLQVKAPSPTKPKGPAVAASLLRRMAGPSDQKAGLTRDKEEVRDLQARQGGRRRSWKLTSRPNRFQVKAIIYEASKGSKYFIAQQKKDEELTVRYELVLPPKESSLTLRRSESTSSSRISTTCWPSKVETSARKKRPLTRCLPRWRRLEC